MRIRIATLALAVRHGQGVPLQSASQRSKDAKKIQRAATALIEIVDEWYGLASGVDDKGLMCEGKTNPFSIDDKARVAAQSALRRGLEPHEFEAARHGLEPWSLRLVLLGLQIHIGEIMRRHPAKAGPPEVWAARMLVTEACQSFKEAGLPVSRERKPAPGKPSLVEACALLLRKAGVSGSVEDLIREFIETNGNNPR